MTTIIVAVNYRLGMDYAHTLGEPRRPMIVTPNGDAARKLMGVSNATIHVVSGPELTRTQARHWKEIWRRISLLERVAAVTVLP